MKDIFNLKDKFVFITGGAGLLGRMHAEAILEHGGKVVISDCNIEAAQSVASELEKLYGESRVHSVYTDVTSRKTIVDALKKYPDINILINNAAKDPKVSESGDVGGKFETLSFEDWKDGINTILDGTFLCSQVFCKKFVNDGSGIIINISSDLGVIAPDQRIYLNDKKPITYSAAKFGIIGMTKYLATYYADKNIRVNAISPGGVYDNQNSEFVKRLVNLIPMGRMAKKDEYKGAIVFLCSEASSYMTGANMTIDGGRTAW